MIESIKNVGKGLVSRLEKLTINPHVGDKFSGPDKDGKIVSIVVTSVATFENGSPVFNVDIFQNDITSISLIKKADLVSTIQKGNLAKVSQK